MKCKTTIRSICSMKRTNGRGISSTKFIVMHCEDRAIISLSFFVFNIFLCIIITIIVGFTNVSQFLSVPDHIRPRVCSLPERPYNPRQSDDLYRLRTFSISKGTVVNCGDSIISRRSRSNTSVNSTASR